MHGRRILIVDGSETVRRTLVTLLRGHGLEVAAAGSAAEALREAQLHPPRLLVVAARPLGPSPLDALRGLRAHPLLAAVPALEVDRIQEITREIDDGWQRCGTASRSLLNRVERMLLRRVPTAPEPPTEALHEPSALSGELALFPLPSMLEWLARAGLSGRFALRGRSVSGALFVDGGAFVHAAVEQPFPCDTDDEAFDLLLTLREGRFELYTEPLPDHLQAAERRPLLGLLMEHLRLRDEATRLAAGPAAGPSEALRP